MASITKIFRDNTDGTYTLVNRSPTKTLSWTFKFHETIHDMGFDGKKHDVCQYNKKLLSLTIVRCPNLFHVILQITFECKDNALYETHVRVEEADKTPETYKYVREGDDLLILILQHKDLLAKRFFKKQA